MKFPLIALTAALCVVMLAACSEKPPRTSPELEPAYNVQNGPSPLYERTLNQGETRRMNP
jgi:hypothetical protein